MEAEHCNSKDSKMEFTTGNYNITTCPQKEWAFAVKNEFDSQQMGHGRVVRNVDNLLENHNGLVPQGGAKMSRHEVIATVLYTGPMVRIFLLHIFSR
jgi:hypothetical protein